MNWYNQKKLIEIRSNYLKNTKKSKFKNLNHSSFIFSKSKKITLSKK